MFFTLVLPHSGRASSHLSSSQGPSTSASNQGLSSSQGPSTSASNQGLSFSQGPSLTKVYLVHLPVLLTKVYLLVKVHLPVLLYSHHSSEYLSTSACNEQTSSNQSNLTQNNDFNGETQLQSMFPNFSSEQILCIFNMSGKSFDKSLDCLISLSDNTPVTLLALARSFLIAVPLHESPCICVDSDDDKDDWTEAAISFYKGLLFKKTAHVKISIRNQPAIDIGGVRRQFFAIVLEHLAHNERYGLFEGLPCSLRPCYRATSLSSGLLTLVGTMVGHNILLDGQGFPYLSECCYYYIAGQIEKARYYKRCQRRS